MAAPKKKIYYNKKEFEKALQAYNDSLYLFNTQNQFNANYLANFKYTPAPPTADVNVIEELKKLATTKNAKATKDNVEDIIKNGLKTSNYSEVLKPSDNLYKAKANKIKGLKIESGHYIPNSKANTWSPLDLLNNDVKDNEHGITIDNGLTVGDNIIKNEASYSRYKRNGVLTNQEIITYGYPHKNIYNNKIKPVGILKYHQEVPDPITTVQGSFNPKDSDYNDATSVNVDLQYYKKPIQQPIFQQPVNINKSISKFNKKPTLTKIPISEISQQEINIKPEQTLKQISVKNINQNNYKETQKYTASKYLQLKGKPSGYINEGNKTGRKEIKAEGGWLDGLPTSNIKYGNGDTLNTGQKIAYNNWIKNNNLNESEDYDLQSYWKNEGFKNPKHSGHFPDTYKKLAPFSEGDGYMQLSEESKYSTNPSYMTNQNNSFDKRGQGYWDNDKFVAYGKGGLLKKANGGQLDGLEGSQILPKDSTQYNNTYNSPANQGRVGFTTEKDYLNNWFSSQRFKDKIGTADPNSISNEAVNKVKTSKLFYNPNDTKGSIENYVDMHTNTTTQDKKELLKHKAVGKSYKDSNDAIITKVEGQNNPNSISIHELTHLTNLDELTKGKFKPALYQDKYGTTRPFNRTEAYPALMQFRYDNNFKPDQVITPEDMKNIRSKGYKNILDDKYTDDEILNYLNTVADNSKGNPNQMAKGGKLQFPKQVIPKSQQEAQALLDNKEYQKQKWRDSLPAPITKEQWDKRKLASGKVEESISPLDFIPALDVAGMATGLAVKGITKGAKLASPLIKNTLNKTGEYLTTKTPLKNTYKVNPWAFKADPEMGYRMLGKEGLEDALNTGVLRAKPIPNQPTNGGISLARNTNRNPNTGKMQSALDRPYFADGAIDERYASDYMAAVNKTENNLVPIPTHKGIAPSQAGSIPLEKATLYKKDWLKGYKEVPKTHLDFRNKLSKVDDVLTKSKFTPPNYIEPNISKITRPYINKEEDIMERFTGSLKGIEKRTKYYTKETAPNYEQLEQMRKTRNYENVPDINNVKQSGFIDSKSILQKYPKGPLTQEEIEAYKNSHYYKTQTKEHLDLKNKYGDQWKLPNHAEEYLQKAIETGDRDYINKVLYGGRNWKTSDYAIAGLIGTAYPAYTGIMGLAFSPPAVKNKVLNKAGITTKPNVLTSRDTTIDITNMPMDFAKVNETKNGKAIIGGEFIEDSNNTVRKAKDWLSATDTYSDKNYPSKDIKSFYGIENGKFKVGKADEFKPETEIVPRRFGDININKAVMNGKEMRLLDKDNKPIYQNTPNTGKFILYSPSTKNSQFVYINTGKNGVNKVNDFLKKNKDAQYIHLDNGRYEYYGVNKEGLTEQDFKNYYEQDLKRKGNPGYNLIIKSNGGWLDNLK